MKIPPTPPIPPIPPSALPVSGSDNDPAQQINSLSCNLLAVIQALNSVMQNPYPDKTEIADYVAEINHIQAQMQSLEAQLPPAMQPQISADLGNLSAAMNDVCSVAQSGESYMVFESTLGGAYSAIATLSNDTING